MDREKLKIIVKNLESLVQCLKSEVYSDKESFLDYEEVSEHITKYEEIDEDDGYPD